MKINNINIAVKILAVLLVLSLYVLTIWKLRRIPTSDEAKSIIYVATFFVIVFSAVDASMIIKTLKKDKQ